MKTRALVGAAWTAMLLCSAAPALADTEAITLDYQVAAGCAGRKDFVSRVHSFTSKAEIVDDDGGAPHRRFSVRVQRSGTGTNGDLTIDDRGAKTTRHVSGATCDEVLSALALATAIAVDPDALGGPNEPAEAPKPPEPPPPKPPPPPPLPPIAPPPTAKPRPARAKPPALSFALGGRLSSAIAPFPKVEASAELGIRNVEPLEFYVGGAFGPPEVNQELQLSDWLGWLGVGYRALSLEPISVAVRAAFEAGAVEATGLNIVDARSVQRPWLAVDVGLEAELAGPGPLFFQANFGGRAPLLWQSYVVTEDKGPRQLYRVAPAGYLFGLSVGVHFL